MATNKYISFNIAGNGGGSGSTGNATALMAQNSFPSSPELGEVVAIKGTPAIGFWSGGTPGDEVNDMYFLPNTAYTGTEVKIADLPTLNDITAELYYGYDVENGAHYKLINENWDPEEDRNPIEIFPIGEDGLEEVETPDREGVSWAFGIAPDTGILYLYNYDSDNDEYPSFIVPSIYSYPGQETGVYQYKGTNWGGIAGGGSVIELTKAQYEALVDKDPDALYVITDADVIDLNDYALSTAVTAEISAATANKADKANVTARTAPYLPAWNAQGVITGETQYYNKTQGINGTNYNVVSSSNTNHPSIFAPTSAGTTGQILQSAGSGAPSWSTYKIVFCSQSAYDALTTPDANTVYIIVDPN